MKKNRTKTQSIITREEFMRDTSKLSKLDAAELSNKSARVMSDLAYEVFRRGVNSSDAGGKL